MKEEEEENKTPHVTTIRQVRNILNNELGITREFVKETIEQRVEVLVAALPMEKIIADVAERVLNTTMNKGLMWSQSRSVKEVVRQTVADAVMRRLNISLKPEGGVENGPADAYF